MKLHLETARAPSEEAIPASADAFSDVAKSTSIRIVLIDDHAAMRRTLKRLLDQEDDLEVVGESDSFERALPTLLNDPADVVVLDVHAAGGCDGDVIAWLRRRAPVTRIVVITMHDHRLYADRALAAGATGFVLKDVADQDLCDAVRRAARGKQYRSARVRRRSAAGPSGRA